MAYKVYVSEYVSQVSNDGEAVSLKSIEDTIADNGGWTLLPIKKIEYNFPDLTFKLTQSSIHNPYNFIKLTDDTINLYFYRTDTSNIRATDKTGKFYFSYTYTMDVWNTFISTWFKSLITLNPDVYFTRCFMDLCLFDEYNNPYVDFRNMWWYRNILPVEIQPDNHIYMEHSQLDLVDYNNIPDIIEFKPYAINGSSASAYPFKKQITYLWPEQNYHMWSWNKSIQWLNPDTAYIDNQNVLIGDSSYGVPYEKYGGRYYYRVMEINTDDFTIDSSIADGDEFQFAYLKDNGERGWMPWTYKTTYTFSQALPYLTFTNCFVQIFEYDGRSYADGVPVHINFSNEKNNKQLKFVPNLNYLSNIAQTDFLNSHYNNKYRYLLVKPSAILPSNQEDNTSITNNGSFCIIPIMNDFTWNTYDASHNPVATPISKADYQQALFQPYEPQTNTPNVLITQNNVIGMFETPFSLPLIQQDAFYVFNKLNNTTNIPIIINFVDFNGLYKQLVNIKIANDIGFGGLNITPSTTQWDESNEPFLYSPQFFSIQLDNSTNSINLIPHINYLFFYSNFVIPLNLKASYDTKPNFFLNPTDMSLNVFKSNFNNNYPISLAELSLFPTTNFMNYLENNLTTERTSYANLKDEHTIMERQIAQGNLSTAIGSVSNVVGGAMGVAGGFEPDKEGVVSKLSATGGVAGAVMGGVKAIGSIIGQSRQNANMRTQFGIKARSINSQFQNIKSSPSTLSGANVSGGLEATSNGIQFHITTLFDEQKKTIFNYLASYGYPYGAVKPLATFNNRQLYNVIQLDSDYNYDLINNYLKTTFANSIFNTQTHRDIFFDWMSSIHRIYNGDNFNLPSKDNIPLSFWHANFISGERYLEIEAEEGTFTYQYSMEKDTPQGVKWSLENNIYDWVSINEDTGLLTIVLPSQWKTLVEYDEKFRIIATSNNDNSKWSAIITLAVDLTEEEWYKTIDVNGTTIHGDVQTGTIFDIGNQNPQLVALIMGHNEWNTALTELRCDTNRLTTLDVSHNTSLTTLDCGQNQITTLDVSHNTALQRLICWNNRKMSGGTLDLSNNIHLFSLEAYSCFMTYIIMPDTNESRIITIEHGDAQNAWATSGTILKSPNTTLKNVPAGWSVINR